MMVPTTNNNNGMSTINEEDYYYDEDEDEYHHDEHETTPDKEEDHLSFLRLPSLTSFSSFVTRSTTNADDDDDYDDDYDDDDVELLRGLPSLSSFSSFGTNTTTTSQSSSNVNTTDLEGRRLQQQQQQQQQPTTNLLTSMLFYDEFEEYEDEEEIEYDTDVSYFYYNRTSPPSRTSSCSSLSSYSARSMTRQQEDDDEESSCSSLVDRDSIVYSDNMDNEEEEESSSRVSTGHLRRCHVVVAAAVAAISAIISPSSKTKKISKRMILLGLLVHIATSMVFLTGLLHTDGFLRTLVLETSLSWFATTNDDGNDTAGGSDISSSYYCDGTSKCVMQVIFFSVFTTLVFFVATVFWVPFSWSSMAMGWLFAKVFWVGDQSLFQMKAVSSSSSSLDATTDTTLASTEGIPMIVVLLATMVVTVGASASAIVSFIVGRFLFQRGWKHLVSSSRNRIGRHSRRRRHRRRFYANNDHRPKQGFRVMGFRKLQHHRLDNDDDDHDNESTTSVGVGRGGGEGVTTVSFLEALDHCCRDDKSSASLPLLSLLRLSPLVPFTILNYWAGATSLSMMTYAKSFLAMIPSIVLFVVWGVSSALVDIDVNVNVDMAEGGEKDGNNTGSRNSIRFIIGVLGTFLGIMASMMAVWLVQDEREEGMMEQWRRRQYQLVLAERRRMRNITNGGQGNIDDDDGDGDMEMRMENSVNSAEEDNQVFSNNNSSLALLGTIEEEEDDEVLFMTFRSNDDSVVEYVDFVQDGDNRNRNDEDFNNEGHGLQNVGGTGRSPRAVPQARRESNPDVAPLFPLYHEGGIPFLVAPPGMVEERLS